MKTMVCLKARGNENWWTFSNFFCQSTISTSEKKLSHSTAAPVNTSQIMMGIRKSKQINKQKENIEKD